MAAWPGSLPQNFIADGYTEQKESKVLRSSMDYGPDKIRKRSTYEPKKISGNMILSAAQKDVLDVFFDQNEALIFTWALGGASVKNYRFLKPPSFSTKSGSWWSVSLSIEEL